GGEARLEQTRAGVPGLIQQHIDAQGEVRRTVGPASGGERGAHAAGELDYAREARGIRARMTRGMNYEIVARDFALQIDLAGDVAHHGVKGEYRFDETLEEEGVIVAARQVGGFVEADLIQ